MPIRTYRDLDVFKESYGAALDVSKLVKRFPLFEQVELARQLRRSARSVPANIVEGWAKRSSPNEFKRYLQMAIGSCDETKMWLELAGDEGYIPADTLRDRVAKYNRDRSDACKPLEELARRNEQVMVPPASLLPCVPASCRTD